MVWMVGMPSAGSPCRRAKAALDVLKPVSVLTTVTDANPFPSGMVSSRWTVNALAPCGEIGVNVVLNCGPPVATKKFTTEPLVKPVPLIIKSSPTSKVPGILEIWGVPGTIVAVAVGVGLVVGVGVGVGLAVGVAVAVAVAVEVAVMLGLGN